MNTTDILENTLDALYTRECYIKDFLTAEKKAYEELLPKHRELLQEEYETNIRLLEDCQKNLLDAIAKLKAHLGW